MSSQPDLSYPLVCTATGQRFVSRLGWYLSHRRLTKLLLAALVFVVLESLVVLAAVDSRHRFPGGLQQPWFAMVLIGTVSSICLALMAQFEIDRYCVWRWRRLRLNVDVLVLDGVLVTILSGIAAEVQFYPTIDELQAVLDANFKAFRPFLRDPNGVFAALSAHRAELQALFAAAQGPQLPSNNGGDK